MYYMKDWIESQSLHLDDYLKLSHIMLSFSELLSGNCESSDLFHLL